MFSKLDKRKTINYTLISLSAIIMLYILFSSNNIIQIYSILKSIKIIYIFIAILSLFAFWIFEAFMIYVLIIKFSDKEKSINTFWLAIKATMIGQYYSNITPFASGGQPVQLYILRDENVPVGIGTAVLLTKFLLFQIGVTFYSLILAIYRIQQLISYKNGVSFFVLTGLLINISMISIIVLIALKPNILVKFSERFLIFFQKHNIIKNSSFMLIKTQQFISEYEVSIRKLKEDIWFTINMFLITFIQLTAYFSITFFIYKSLNLKGSNMFEVICLQSFLYMAVSFIPTPGTAGGSEIGFILLLGHVFPVNIIGTALILWRGISYYFSLLFSGIFSLSITTLIKKKSIVQ